MLGHGRIFENVLSNGNTARLTVFIRVGERDHVLGENLWHAAYTSGDDVQARTSGLKDGNSE
jgi:hypothetical protein